MTENKKIHWIYTIQYCLRQAFQTSKLFTCMRVIINVLISINTLILSFVGMKIINLLTESGTPETLMRNIVLLMIASCLIKSLSIIYNKLLAYIVYMHNELLEKKMTISFMDISMKADIAIFDNPDYYNRLEMAKQDTQSVIDILWSFIDMISGIFSLICVLFVLIPRESLSSVLILAASIPSTIVMRYTTKKIYDLRCGQINKEREKYYYSIISSEKTFSQLIRVNRIENIIKRKYEQIWNNLHQEKKKMYKKKYMYEIHFGMVPEIICMLSVIFVIRKVVYGEYTIGEYTLYSGLFSMLYSQTTLVLTNAVKIYDNKMKLENILIISSLTPSIRSGYKEIWKIDSIEFDNVSFRYPNSTQYVLKNISFKISRGEKIALVGENGSGKSTLIKLLFRFYNPISGVIRINGEDINEFKIDSLRNCMDCYLQNSVNLAAQIQVNVDLRNATEEYFDKEIKEALEKSSADDILNKCNGNLSKKMMKVFDKDALELSEGQHQKVAISRVFFTRKSLVIFDEPSSSLDPAAEDKIFYSIEELSKDGTVIFTSHRYTNLFLASRIIVLCSGRIVEDGTKDELINKKGEFYRLYECQAGKFSK